MNNILRPTSLLLLLASLASSSGCAMMNSSLTSAQVWPFRKKEPEFVTPRQLVPVWSDTVLHQAGEPATRGFGGRVMFYGEDKHKPIRVDGTLVVYVWDDSNGSMERTPDRKYVFPSDKLQSHYSTSRLGHSYSFWVPWDAAGGQLTHLTLISRFVSNDGLELTSTPAHVVLQGPMDTTARADRDSLDGENRITRSASTNHGIRQVAHKDTDDAKIDGIHTNATEGRSRRHISGPAVRTSSIDLPDGFLERNLSNTSPRATGNAQGDASRFHSQGSSSERQNDQVSELERLNRPKNQGDVESDTEAATRSPSARLQPFESRVRAARAVRSSSDHLRKEPLRATWLNGLPETPRATTDETP